MPCCLIKCLEPQIYAASENTASSAHLTYKPYLRAYTTWFVTIIRRCLVISTTPTDFSLWLPSASRHHTIYRRPVKSRSISHHVWCCPLKLGPEFQILRSLGRQSLINIRIFKCLVEITDGFQFLQLRSTSLHRSRLADVYQNPNPKLISANYHAFCGNSKKHLKPWTYKVSAAEAHQSFRCIHNIRISVRDG